MKMKHSDAADHHAKRPHTAHRPHHPAHTEHNGGKKVFDVMRPGKAPASPTSRPVIVGHKAEAQKTQAAVSGIGAAPKTQIDIKPDDQEHAIQVAAAASASVAAEQAADPEDTPAGAPPVAVALDPPVAVAPSVTPLSPESVADLNGEKPPAADAPAPKEESVPEPAEPEAKGPPPPDIVPDSNTAPEATHNLAHGKTIMPLSADKEQAAEQRPETPPAATADAQPAAVEASAPEAEAPKEAPQETSKKAAADAKEPAVPELHPQDIQDIVVSHHATSVWWHSAILIILVIVLAVIALDILLDAEMITLPINVPYTDFF